MEFSKIIRALELHGVDFFINGLQIIAFSGYTADHKEIWQNVAGYTVEQMKDFLNYC